MTWCRGLAVSFLTLLFAGAVYAVELKLPYMEEGLSREEAAAYLLERFAFGRAMRVPAPIEELNESNTTFDKTPGKQTVIRE